MGRVDNDWELVNQKHLEPEDAKKLLGFQLDVRGFTIHPRQNISSAKKSSCNLVTAKLRTNISMIFLAEDMF